MVKKFVLSLPTCGRCKHWENGICRLSGLGFEADTILGCQHWTEKENQTATESWADQEKKLKAKRDRELAKRLGF